MSDEEALDILIAAYRLSVALKRTKEEGEFNNFYHVDAQRLTLAQSRRVLEESGEWHHEGGTAIGSGVYDLALTPKGLVKEHGVASEYEEGIVRVAMP